MNVMQPRGDTLIPYLQRRAGRALAEVYRLEGELRHARVACDHAVMALREARTTRSTQLRSGKVAK